MKFMNCLFLLVFFSFINAEVITIAEARKDANNDGVPDREGETVTVQGICIGNSNILFYIQDETAGVNIYISELSTTYYIGDKIEVTGVVTFYKGLTEIKPSSEEDIKLISKSNSVSPFNMPYSTSLSEKYEGSLLSFGDCRGSIANWKVVEVGTNPSLSGTGYAITALWGKTSFEIYIYPETGIDVKNIKKGDKIIITGIGGQYDPEEPYLDGYQLLPRQQSDIIKLKMEGTTDEVFVKTEKNLFNPKNGETCLISIGTPASYKVNVAIYDIKGRKKLNIMQNRTGGLLFYTWDGRDDLSRILPAGIYIIQLKTQDLAGKWETKMQTIGIGTRLK